jgi:hypothetical protein
MLAWSGVGNRKVSHDILTSCCPLAPSGGEAAEAPAKEPAAANPRGGITEAYPYKDPTGQQCSVFISHAGEQKQLLAAFLKEGLEARYPGLRGRVFLDDMSLPRGGNAMEGIYHSLRDAFVGEWPALAGIEHRTWHAWQACVAGM